MTTHDHAWLAPALRASHRLNLAQFEQNCLQCIRGYCPGDQRFPSRHKLADYALYLFGLTYWHSANHLDEREQILQLSFRPSEKVQLVSKGGFGCLRSLRRLRNPSKRRIGIEHKMD